MALSISQSADPTAIKAAAPVITTNTAFSPNWNDGFSMPSGYRFFGFGERKPCTHIPAAKPGQIRRLESELMPKRFQCKRTAMAKSASEIGRERVSATPFDSFRPSPRTSLAPLPLEGKNIAGKKMAAVFLQDGAVARSRFH